MTPSRMPVTVTRPDACDSDDHHWQLQVEDDVTRMMPCPGRVSSTDRAIAAFSIYPLAKKFYLEF